MSMPNPDETPRKWEMRVAGLAVDPVRGDPVVLLRDLDNQHQIPIWIGQVEAVAIATELQGIRHPRPMTHDLLKNALTQLGCTVSRIEINDLKDNTFYARIVVVRGGEEIAIDSRPSDALALAIRAGARVYAYDHVLREARMDPPDESELAESEEAELEEGRERRRVRIRVRTEDEDARTPFQGPAPKTDDEWDRYLEDLDPDDFGKYKH